MGSRALPEKVKNLEMVSVDCPSVEDSSVFVLFWRGSSTQRKNMRHKELLCTLNKMNRKLSNVFIPRASHSAMREDTRLFSG